MDKRIEKTKKSLCDAFFQLRAKKSVHEIRITELCKLANLNKTTFYTHYRDIYELSEDMEKQLLYKIVLSIPQDVDYNFSNPTHFTREIMLAFERYRDEMLILFRDNDSSHLSVYLEQGLKTAIFSKHPRLKDNAELNIMLTYCIHGAANAQMLNRDLPMETIIATVEKIVSALQPLMEEAAKKSVKTIDSHSR